MGSEARNSGPVVWHQALVTREQREAANGHKAAAVWFTGLPSAGKSTIAHEVERRLFDPDLVLDTAVDSVESCAEQVMRSPERGRVIAAARAGPGRRLVEIGRHNPGGSPVKFEHALTSGNTRSILSSP